MTEGRRDFTPRELEVCAVGSIKLIHVFPPNGDTVAAQKRLAEYSSVVRDFKDFILRR